MERGAAVPIRALPATPSGVGSRALVRRLPGRAARCKQSGDSLYYHDVDDVFGLALDGSGSTQVTPDDEFRYIWLLAVDETHAYYDDAPLRMLPLSGGEPTALGRAGPDGFGTDAGFTSLSPVGDVVYLADDTESWGWTAKDGMSCAILGQHNGMFDGAVAISSSYVYARGDSAIYRAARVD